MSNFNEGKQSQVIFDHLKSHLNNLSSLKELEVSFDISPSECPAEIKAGDQDALDADVWAVAEGCQLSSLTMPFIREEMAASMRKKLGTEVTVSISAWIIPSVLSCGLLGLTYHGSTSDGTMAHER